MENGTARPPAGFVAPAGAAADAAADAGAGSACTRAMLSNIDTRATRRSSGSVPACCVCARRPRSTGLSLLKADWLTGCITCWASNPLTIGSTIAWEGS